MHTSRLIVLFILLFNFLNSNAQGITLNPKKLNTSEIYENLKKLNFLGSVLYLAAHPDDENTAAISYFANKIKARTAYLSLTRGDGGQNIIGPQLRELLGVMRTQELLAARATDGGEQRFTRANDFGFSKHPEETLAIWDKKEILGDVVWAIRTFRPDIIINRFDHRTPGTTHGHHTSSAILGVEAFDLAADASQYPDQLENTQTWQPKRQFFNTSWWFYGGKDKFEKVDKSNLVKIDLGNYYQSLGLSNTEIAALSRSQHKSQGFGTTAKRGVDENYFELIKGEKLTTNNFFEGIDTTWNRVKGGKAVQEIIQRIITQYDFKNPQKSIALLTKAYTQIQETKDLYWKKVKSQEIKDLIIACSGLYLEAATNTPLASNGDDITLHIEAINRSNASIKINKAIIISNKQDLNINSTLLENQKTTTQHTFTIDPNFNSTSPYWLQEPGTLGMYKVADSKIIGAPETPSQNKIRFDLSINGVSISIEKPIVYKFNDRIKGEVYQPFEIVPPVSVKLDSKIFIFSDATTKKIPVTITANKSNFTGTVFLEHANGWKISPKQFTVTIENKKQSKQVIFNVTPPSKENNGFINPIVTANGKNYSKEMVLIDYNHIPLQTVFLPTKAKTVRLNIKRSGNKIGYIQGAGDAIPESLEQIGYEVSTLDPKTITSPLLANLDAIVVGIRAYNLIKELPAIQPLLLKYVEDGGTLIAQYNTKSRSGNTNVYPPYPLEVSRDRVTNENSDVSILAKKHPIINYPNPITKKDFEGWTQERGLYFPNKWDKEYTPILSMNDKGESPKKGSILVAKYGKGHYIYTGISFFRELPAGVSGAYKLFVNMLSIGNQKTN